MADKERHGDSRPASGSRAFAKILVRYQANSLQHYAGMYFSFQPFGGIAEPDLTLLTNTATDLANAMSNVGSRANWVATGWAVRDLEGRIIQEHDFASDITGLYSPQSGSTSNSSTVTISFREPQDYGQTTRPGKTRIEIFTGTRDFNGFGLKRVPVTQFAALGALHDQLVTLTQYDTANPITRYTLVSKYNHLVNIKNYVTTDVNSFYYRKHGF